MMIVAFSPAGTLFENRAPSGSVTMTGDPVLRSPAEITRILRELDRLGVLQLLAADMPSATLERLADALDFKGTVVSSPRPLADAQRVTTLLPECFWWVTGDQREAIEAADIGFNVVFFRDARACSPVIEARCVAVIHTLDELLAVIRIPYTRGALAIRHLLRDLKHCMPEGA